MNDHKDNFDKLHLNDELSAVKSNLEKVNTDLINVLIEMNTKLEEADSRLIKDPSNIKYYILLLFFLLF